MRRDLARAARVLSLPTVALAATIAFAPGRAELAVRVYALLLCAVALVLVVAALHRAYPAATPLRGATARGRARRRAVPSSLARIRQETALGVAGSFDLHHRLRPRLRGLAGELLAARHRVALDTEHERARALLGNDAWELVRPDRPPPEDRLARGLPISDLRRVVESLEEA